MKKSILALALVSMVAISCGDKKSTDTTAPEAVEQTTEAPKQKELTYSIEWTAFKTPAKVGVKGTFDQVKLSEVNQEAATLAEGLKGAQFSIVTSSASTGDPARDETLRLNFFSKLVGNINGFFGEFKDGKVLVNLTLNGITKEKEFTYEATETGVKLNGSIDIIADFTAQDAFNALHEACNALHEGKTWSDVEIAVEIKK
ncbi:YceI family protein [Myroides odoratus]|uniref:YceI family protein n=1 Tax=Myroides odoratus TaxID=256 RepID=UPI0007660C2E|nr:YceI family protein [Myroides odoratus]